MFHLRGTPKSFEVKNEKYLHFPKGSKERESRINECEKIRKQECIEIPCIVNGEEIKTGKTVTVMFPSDNKKVLFKVHMATQELMKKAIKGALEAKKKWEDLPIGQKSSIFFKAAEILSGEKRDHFGAVIMMTQGKTLWQSEIDVCELIDFLRFNCKYAMDIYETQPPENFKGCWNKIDYRPLEGFVATISPFNFAAIQGNLNTSPVLMGNVACWKPGTSTAYTAYTIYQALKQAGLPDGVIQFLPSSGGQFSEGCLKSPQLAGIHFTGGTSTFQTIMKTVVNNIDQYKSFPKFVGETGGKNFHILEKTGNIDSFVNNTLRGAFEYSGQKCSATSRIYVPKDLWEKEVKEKLVKGMKELKFGQPDDPKSFSSCVIDEKAYKRIIGFIDRAKKDNDVEIIAGGNYSTEKGWFVDPTLIVSKTPKSETMENEIFGPVLTAYVYDCSFEEVLDIVDSTSEYALTGSIFSQCRYALNKATSKLRNSCGNFYINDKSTGAVVGQQPFGGARKSGTNDKAGAPNNLYRWISPRSIKETFVNLQSPFYPSIDVEN